jgi:hypothetical protein
MSPKDILYDRSQHSKHTKSKDGCTARKRWIYGLHYDGFPDVLYGPLQQQNRHETS